MNLSSLESTYLPEKGTQREVLKEHLASGHKPIKTSREVAHTIKLFQDSFGTSHSTVASSTAVSNSYPFFFLSEFSSLGHLYSRNPGWLPPSSNKKCCHQESPVEIIGTEILLHFQAESKQSPREISTAMATCLMASIQLRFIWYHLKLAAFI